MHIPWDLDVIVFLSVVAMVVFASMPQLRKNATLLPFHYEFEEVAPGALTQAQADCFAWYDTRLESIQYRPVGNYRVSNYGHNLMRSYVSAADTCRCIVIIVEVRVNVAGSENLSHTRTVEWITRFADGRALVTRNMKLQSVLAPFPDYVVQECRNLDNPVEMKRIHDRGLAALGAGAVPLPPARDLASIFEEIAKEHDQISKFRLECGDYRVAPVGNGYALTDRVFWRGIRNYLNPFVHHFSAMRLLTAVMTAAALAIAMVKVLPRIVQAMPTVEPATASLLAGAVLCALAGALIGYALEQHGFLWAFVLVYVAVHAASGWATGLTFGGLVAAMAAQYLQKIKNNRQMVLLSRSANKTRLAASGSS